MRQDGGAVERPVVRGFFFQSTRTLCSITPMGAYLSHAIFERPSGAGNGSQALVKASSDSLRNPIFNSEYLYDIRIQVYYAEFHLP